MDVVTLPGKPTGRDPRETTLRGWSGIKSRGPVAKLELTDAYSRVFGGGASQEDCEAVLADLAQFSGFYSVVPHGSNADMLFRCEGARSVFGRIQEHLNMTENERSALQRAAREQALLNQQLGEI